jgi:uncharacterized SAM-binding protein YcdF (DUF218 family)
VLDFPACPMPCDFMISFSDLFFILSKVLTVFVFPLPLLFITTAFFFFKLKKNSLKLIAFLIWGFFLFLSTNYGSDMLLRPLEESNRFIPPEDCPNADAIVVLGGMTNPLSAGSEKMEFLGTVERILSAEDLLRLEKAPILLISGGSGELVKGQPEADLLKDWIQKRITFKGLVLSESESRNTRENALYSSVILKQNNVKKIILITSAFHMKRSLISFSDLPFEIIPYPVDFNTTRTSSDPFSYVPAPMALYLSTVAIKEYIGIIAYEIRIKLKG